MQIKIRVFMIYLEVKNSNRVISLNIARDYCLSITRVVSNRPLRLKITLGKSRRLLSLVMILPLVRNMDLDRVRGERRRSKMT